MKENILKIKRLLERKCFASNYGSEYNSESYLSVINSIDNESAVDYITRYIDNAINYYIYNGISFNEIQLFPLFSLYFDSKYEDKYLDIIKKNIKPISNILRVNINGVGYTYDGVQKTIEPDEIYDNKEFVITFDDFKSMLEERGITLQYSSYEDILKDYRNQKPTVCKITKSKTKINILTR